MAYYPIQHLIYCRTAAAWLYVSQPVLV